MFTAALVTIAKNPCPSTDEQMNKMWSIHTIEYDSAIKRKEALTHTTDVDEH